jgi:hypothetical protein
MADPMLSEDRRQALVSKLMRARRAVRDGLRAEDAEAVRLARERVDETKRALGERGPVWWTEGAPDYNRHMARNSPYADWFEGITPRRP